MVVRISRPAKTAMQSGRANSRMWIVEYEPAVHKEIDPLMGWVGSRDTRAQLRLKFSTKEEAIAYAEREGLEYKLLEEHGRKQRPKSYSDNFRYNRVEL